MLNRIKIRNVANILGGLIFFLGVSFYFLSANIKAELTLVNDTWEDYQLSKSEKARLESALRSAIGYGGMIHDFKNFVLRKNNFYLDSLQSHIGAARIVLNQYRSLGINGAERIALSDIENMLTAYHDAALQVDEMIKKKNVSAEEIDSLVRIDDVLAFRGLEILEQEVFEGAGEQGIDEASNGRLVALLRAQIGYGGVIHHFKNYILRQEDQFVPAFESSLKNALDIIEEYNAREITSTERVALHDISKTLSNYGLAFQRAREMTATAEKIDAVAKLDDAAALRSLSLLDREIVALTERHAKNVQITLSRIQSFMNYSVLWGFSFAIFVVLVAIYAIRGLILSPIEGMTKEMMLLAKGEDNNVISGIGLKNEIGNMARAVVVFQDNLKKLKKAEESLRAQAMTDPLTKLANRSYFEIRLKESINLAKRLDTHGAVLSIDLDGFKAINDTHGHPAGDHVLKIISDRFVNISREVDVVARLGGDEFSIIMIGLEQNDQIEPLAERVILEASRPIIYEETKLKVTASIGISFFLTHGDTVTELARKSDLALYEAKNKGKNQFSVYEETENVPPNIQNPEIRQIGAEML